MQELDHLTAVILAGGLGTRLRPVLADRPKALAEIRGRPFLAYLLDHLDKCGLKHAVLCVGYGAEQVREEFGERHGRLRLAYSWESSPLDTGGALRLALPLLESDPVLVLNGDSYCDVDLASFYAWHCARPADASLLLLECSETARYGRVEVEASLVTRFEEKGDVRGAGWVNAGIYLLSRRFVEAVPEGRAVSLEREVFPAWVGRGLFGYQARGRFFDIGTPEAYAAAGEFFEPLELCRR